MHEEPFKALHNDGGECDRMVVVKDNFFGTGMMVEALRHAGTTTWLSDVLKMSVKISVSSTAQSLSGCPGMLLGPGALWGLILPRDLLTLSGDSVTTQSLGAGGGVFCAGVQFCTSK